MADDLSVLDALAAAIVIRMKDIGGGILMPLTDISGETAGQGRTKIDTASSGDNTIATSSGSLKVKLLSIVLVADSAVTVTFKDVGGAVLTGAMALSANTPFILPMVFPGYHWLETTPGDGLVMNLSGAIQVSGWLVSYTEL